MKELCSCGASFAYTRPSAANWDTSTAERLLRDWRQSHRHEFPPAEPMPDEPPTIVESGSSHERLGEYYGADDRVPIGFQRNEVR